MSARNESEDMLARLRLDAGSRSFGELAQEREWAYGEIVLLRERLSRYGARTSHGESTNRRNDEIKNESRERPSCNGLRYLRLRDVCARVGLKASGIYRLMSIGRFPKQVKLSERTVVWIESEIEAFMDSRITERDTQAQQSEKEPSPNMRMGEVLKRTGLTSSQLYDLIRKGKFPKWADLPKIASGWIREDVEVWIAAFAEQHKT